MRTYDDTMFIDTFEHEYTWLNGFMRNVARFSKKDALIDPETQRKWNYKSLNEESNRLANALQAMGIGKAIIEVVPEEEKTKVKATCSITVGRAVEKIGLPETATVNINRTIKLKPEIFPQEALSKGVEYSSSDESVVKVAKNGSVKGIASGNAVITCTATDGSGVSASCVITVP